MKHKWIAKLLAGTMAVSMMPFSVFAAQGRTGWWESDGEQGHVYTLKEDTTLYDASGTYTLSNDAYIIHFDPDGSDSLTLSLGADLELEGDASLTVNGAGSHQSTVALGGYHVTAAPQKFTLNHVDFTYGEDSPLHQQLDRDAITLGEGVTVNGKAPVQVTLNANGTGAELNTQDLFPGGYAVAGDKLVVTLPEGMEVSAYLISADTDLITFTQEDDGYTATLPAEYSGDLSLTVIFRARPFTDVSEDAWYYDAIYYAYENGLMAGSSATRFYPEANLSRAMIAQILYNLEGTPAAGEAVFPDVADGQWYTNAINWAAAQGLVAGYGNGEFGPDDAVTREQLAVILYHYAQLKGYDTSVSGDLSAFHDGASASDWAVEALEWAVSHGVMAGKGGSLLDPTGTAQRAEVTQMLMNYLTSL